MDLKLFLALLGFGSSYWLNINRTELWNGFPIRSVALENNIESRWVSLVILQKYSRNEGSRSGPRILIFVKHFLNSCKFQWPSNDEVGVVYEWTSSEEYVHRKYLFVVNIESYLNMYVRSSSISILFSHFERICGSSSSTVPVIRGMSPFFHFSSCQHIWAVPVHRIVRPLESSWGASQLINMDRSSMAREINEGSNGKTTTYRATIGKFRIQSITFVGQ